MENRAIGRKNKINKHKRKNKSEMKQCNIPYKIAPNIRKNKAVE